MGGLNDPGVVDLVTQDQTGEIALIVSHAEPWDYTAAGADKLRHKLNNYAFYALDEGLLKDYPQAAGHDVRIQIDCSDVPRDHLAEVVDNARRGLEQYGVRLVVNLLGPRELPEFLRRRMVLARNLLQRCRQDRLGLI